MIKRDYEIELTHGARAWSALHASPAALKARVIGEIALSGCRDPMKLVFHTFEWDRRDKQEFIVWPSPDKKYTILVDTCTRETGEKAIERCRFAAKKISMPVPDSE